MVRLTRSTIIDASVDEVWRILRDFNGHAEWHPAIASSRIEAGDAADAVGAVRAFALADGSFLREQLIALSDRDMRLTYCLLEAPIPLMGYVATMHLRPVTDGDRTFLLWESRFEPPPEQAETLARRVAEDIYEAGFAALKARFALEPTHLPHAEVPAAGGPRSTHNGVSGAFWRLLRGRPDHVGPAPQDEGGWVEEATSPARATAIETGAIVVERHGGPEVLSLRTIRVPPPGPGEVRLRHTAIGVNYIDVYCRTGFFRLLEPPAIPGMEAAGVIVDVGPGVRLRPGDRVVYAGGPVGAYAGMRTMDATLLVPLPADIDDETAAATFLKGLTAEFLLHRVHSVQAGDTILVHAAAGGVGTLLCQWARALGAEVIGTVSTDEKAEHAQRFGCHHTIDYTREDFVEAVRRLTHGRGVDVVYDAVGSTTFAKSLDALAIRGHLVSHGQASGPVGMWDVGALASKSLTISRPNFAHYTDTPDKLNPMAERLFEALRQRIIVPVIGGRFPLADAAQAHRRLEARRTIGSLVLLP